MSKETNAERLERIKHKPGGIYCMESESVESKDVPVEDFDWLIEQAEKTQKLNELIVTHAPDGRNYTNAQYVELLHERQSLYEEVNRLREALAFYADGANWSVEIIKDNGNKHRIAHVVTGDSGQKALKALKGEQ